MIEILVLVFSYAMLLIVSLLAIYQIRISGESKLDQKIWVAIISGFVSVISASLPLLKQESPIIVTIPPFVLMGSAFLIYLLPKLMAPLIGKVLKRKSKATIKPDEHLIMRLLKKKVRENRITYMSLCFAFAGEYVLYRTVPQQQTSVLWIMILTAFLLIGNFIKQRILKYRVDHGLYGTSYLEAKEIISFMLEWYRENGDSNSKPPKLVFTQEEIDQCLQVNGGEEYAG